MSKNKVKSVTVGLDEVQAKRINVVLERHFRKPIREYENAIENLPKRKEMREKIVEYLTMELEKYPFENEPQIHNFLRSNRDYYDKDVLESILRDEQILETKERFIQTSKEFLEHIHKFIKITDNTIEYDSVGLETFLMLIDQFDLDDKQKQKLEQQRQLHTPSDEE